MSGGQTMRERIIKLIEEEVIDTRLSALLTNAILAEIVKALPEKKFNVKSATKEGSWAAGQEVGRNQVIDEMRERIIGRSNGHGT